MCVAPPLKVSALFNPVTRQWVVLSSRLSSTPPLEKIFYTFNSANPGLGTNLCGWRPRAGPFQSKWHTRLLSDFTDLGQGNTLQLAMISDCQTEFGHGVHALTSSLLEPTYFDERCILILYVLSVDNMMRLLATFSGNAPLPLIHGPQSAAKSRKVAPKLRVSTFQLTRCWTDSQRRKLRFGP